MPVTKVNYLPAKYNEQSKLKATINANGSVEPSKFDLQSK